VAERFRDFLDRPLDPSAARAVLGLALAIGTGLAFIGGLDGLGGHAPQQREDSPAASTPATVGRAVLPAPAPSRQDPQDRPGSAAHRRAALALSRHRALQHVPYSADGVSIALVGARHGKAVLRVEAATRVAARQGWRAFLRRFDDGGGAYLHVLAVGEAGGR
jgi:hypothetical protein